MAVPNPERELERLKKVLRAGLPACLVIRGASGFFRQQAFDLAFAAIPEDADLRSLDGETDTDGRELDDLRGGTLFGRGSVLALRRGEAPPALPGPASRRGSARPRPGTRGRRPARR